MMTVKNSSFRMLLAGRFAVLCCHADYSPTEHLVKQLCLDMGASHTFAMGLGPKCVFVNRRPADVISIEKTGENFRLVFDVKGRFAIHRITAEEAKYKLCKVKSQKVGPKGIPYVNTHDGRTVRYPDPLIKVNDTIKLDIETGKVCLILAFVWVFLLGCDSIKGIETCIVRFIVCICFRCFCEDLVPWACGWRMYVLNGKQATAPDSELFCLQQILEFVKFEAGNVAMVTGGRSLGRVGVITHIERHHGGFDIVHVKDVLGHDFATRIQNIFVVGEGNKPMISLPKGKGVKLSIAEERDRRLAQKA